MSSESPLPSASAVLWDATKSSYLIVFTFVMMFAGVGQLSARAGLDVLQTGVMTALTLAAPAQAAAMSIVLSAGGAAGGAWMTALTAVFVINLRFIVMVASVMARLPRMSIPRTIGTLGLLSASSFAVAFPRLVDHPPRRPALFVLFLCLLCCVSAVVGAVIGHSMSGTVSPLLGAVLGAVIPVYFATLLANQWKERALMLNAVAGAILVPLAAPVLGSTSLLVVPLVFAALSVALRRRTNDA
ncbi:MAG: AzlC family ABC transporter permease [Rhodospirillaceae bacterium]|nr:AzlC family ABC transporter permease [Rhodospirillaceae bacterium]